MKARDIGLLAVSLSRWLFVTLVAAIFSPWLVLGCFFCVASFLPEDVRSFRDTVTQAAIANSDAWKSGAVTWHGFSQLCFIAVCAARVFFSPAARKAGEWFGNRLTKWIGLHFSECQQRRFARIAFGSFIAACLVLGVAASKMDHSSRAPMPETPAFTDAPGSGGNTPFDGTHHKRRCRYRDRAGTGSVLRQVPGPAERPAMSAYQIAGQVFEGNDPRLPEVLASLHGQKFRPLCLCIRPHPEMYIAKLGTRYLLKRMPNTGSAHSPECDSFEPPAELSGLGEVLPAIEENIEDGTTALKLGFSLTKISGRTPPVPSGKEPETAKSAGNKLGLRSTLHYLWEQAGFSRWSPSMTGKRSWGVIRKYLLQAAESKRTKGTAMNDLLYVPEPFFLDHKDEIAQRRLTHLHRVLVRQPGHAQQLMLLIAEVKQIIPARFGQKLVAKQLPDCPFMLSDDLHQRIVKLFDKDLALWNATEGSHLVIIGTFSTGPYRSSLAARSGFHDV